MALLYPFQGFRYNLEAVRDLNLVVTQPYDKTTPSMQDAYYLRSPYNAVRITLNLEKRENPGTDYAGAGATFRHWLDQGILIQDPLPAIYPYYQQYAMEGRGILRKGFIALLDLKDFGAGILPHELTLAAPKQDRLQLLRSLEGNEDLIYMLYADAERTVNEIMDRSISGRRPVIEVRDEYETFHRVWSIADPAALKGIGDAMLALKLFIADGHHRFETSVNFMKECEQKGWKPAGPASFDKRLIACFNSADGVTILPTHRLIRDLAGFDAGTYLNDIQRHFQVEPAETPEELWKKMKQGIHEKVFGFYPAGLKKFFLLRLRKEAFTDPALMKHGEAYRDLDVSILHALLLDHYLGIDEGRLAAQSNLDYARDPEFCIGQVHEGKYQAVFFLNPTTAGQMMRVASLGERMPQKSTDFFPKLLTGLVFMKMQIEKM